MKALHDMISRMNPGQKEAVLHTVGPLIVMAGAGSGKTSTMTVRIGKLLEEGVPPEKIIGITFTNKACNEMRERLATLIDNPSVSKRVTFSTFHAFGHRILRENPEMFGRDKKFTLLDEHDHLDLWKDVIDGYFAAPSKSAYKTYPSMISRWKNYGWYTEHAIRTHEHVYEDSDQFLLDHGIVLFSLYEKEMERLNAFDFDDLILKAKLLLQKNPEVLHKYQNMYDYWSVDEYQDTNLTQYEILSLLQAPRGNVCIVGDSDQSIYRWRGANEDNWKYFMRDFPTYHMVILNVNYRSKKKILESANQLIVHNNQTVRKIMLGNREEGNSPVLRLVSGTEFEYGNLISEDIRSKIEAGYKYKHMAILLRTRLYLRQIEYSLQQNKIPYEVENSTTFFETPILRSLISYLTIIENPSLDIPLLRVINIPERFVGVQTKLALRRYAERRKLSVWSVLTDVDEISDIRQIRSKNGVKQFYTLVNRLKEQIQALPVDSPDFLSKACRAVLNTMRLEEFYLSENASDEGYEFYLGETIKQFFEIVDTFTNQFKSENLRYPALSDFLSFVSLGAATTSEDAVEDKVRILTIHGAKGLEFPVVYMPFVREGELPHKNVHDAKSEAEYVKQLEEERRLCYVGITRAQDHLILLSDFIGSMFIQEIEGTVESEDDLDIPF